jgi:hypothetical protein
MSANPFGDGHLDGVERRLDGINSRLDGMDRRFEGIDRRLDGIDHCLDGMEQRFDLRFTSLEQKIDRHFLWIVGLIVVAIILPLMRGVVVH